MSEELQQKLRAQLWEVANNLRGNMSANEFMYFSLGFIFYKYLSEKIENYADRALEDDEITFKQLWQSGEEDALELQEEVKKQCLENIGYFVEPQYLFTSIIDAIKRKENIIPSLERSLKRIEDSTLGQESEDDFGGLFSDIDLASPKLGKTTDDKNTLISNVLIALNGIDFGADEATQIDILGDAYEYMISQFAAGAGKKAGEFYTPQEVSQILAEIVTIGHTRLRNVYDPTCGSGSLLIRAAHTGRAYEIFGQEKNPTTYNLCRMNMLLHGIKFSNFQIENGDTLRRTLSVTPSSMPWLPILLSPQSGVPPTSSTMMTVSAVPVALLRARQLTMPLYCTCSIILWMVVQWLALYRTAYCSVVMPRALSAVSLSRRRTALTQLSACQPISSTALPFPLVFS